MKETNPQSKSQTLTKYSQQLLEEQAQINQEIYGIPEQQN